MIAPWTETISVALACVAALVAMLFTYRRMRYWEQQARAWRQRLKAQLDVLRALIRDARETQHAYREADDPVRLRLDGLGRIDLTGALALKTLIDDARGAGLDVAVEGSPAHAERILDRVLRSA